MSAATIAYVAFALVLTQSSDASGSKDALTFWSGLGLLLFFISGALVIWFSKQEYEQKIAAQEHLIATLQEANNGVQQELTKWQECYRTVITAMDEVTRKKVVAHINRSLPMPNPPPGIPLLIQEADAVEAPPDQTAWIAAIGWITQPAHQRVTSFWLSVHPRSEAFTGHIAVAGETRSGKGALIFTILAQLALRTRPEQLKLFAIDPKEDFALWEGKAHNWREPVLGRDPDMVRGAMQAISSERARRVAIRRRAQVLEWADIPAALRPPILVVYLAELDLMPVDDKELDAWLTEEMSTSLSEGIVFLLDIQNATRLSTRWRTHFGTNICGVQGRQAAVEPNLGISVSEVRAAGAIPPNELQRGQFTVRSGRDIESFSAPLITIEHRREMLAHLPRATDPLTILPPRPEDAEPASSESREEGHAISPEEEGRILRAADELEEQLGPQAKRTDVALRVYGRATGEEYQKVKYVLDTHRRILPGRRPATAIPTPHASSA